MTDDSKKHDCGVYARVRARKIHIASRHHLRTYANGSVPPSNFISINSRQALLRSAFTTKKHDGTRSHAAKALPRRSTKEHEEARRNTKPCGGGFNVDVWGAAASLPRTQRCQTIFSAKGRAAMRPHRRKASCSFVALGGKAPFARLRVSS